MNTTIERVWVDGLTMAYRELGEGPAVLLLHGWPTSSYLWRNVMPAIAANNRVLALDLPGFGGSDKPLDERYDFPLFENAIDAFLDTRGVDEVAIAVHDLGGPIGLHWALNRPERVTRIALLNTLVYPEFSEAVVEFVTQLSTPDSRDRLTSPEGLAEVMRFGVSDPGALSDEVIAAVVEPFEGADERRALAQAGIQLSFEGFTEIAALLPHVKVPLRAVYGELDRVLPDVSQTMERVKRDVPHAELTALGVGHFLQEEAPEQVGELLAEFFARAS